MEEEEPRFLLVQNRKPISKDFPHQFTVCLSTMFDFTNVLQLVQSMEMLRILGVTQVVLYKTSCNADTQRLLDHYERTGFLEVIAWPLAGRLNVSRSWRPDLGAGQLHYYGQVAALNDCVYRNMYRSHYLGLHDMDELILPQAVDSWTELLPQLELKHGPGRSYVFQNHVFPTSISGTPSAPSSETRPTARWQEVEGVNILDHLYHEPPDTVTWSNHKIIVDPRAVVQPTVHGLLNPTHITVAVPPSVARMYHTRAAAKAGLRRINLTFDGRLLDYRDRLVRVVDEVLERTGLLHPSREGPPLGGGTEGQGMVEKNSSSTRT
ncbi:uncharacterized protein LOC132474287 [Gadus macrocephalus]|uniref:uncharacterized protein LOC132474287 n=1 Tax=Gadus macrocephalus TaxID=80720 RepID=UPI0028CB296C|nr:uncharacterized protein LOC132474287 [Gadus macrocephalus]